jgi:hypothetical protein
MPGPTSRPSIVLKETHERLLDAKPLSISEVAAIVRREGLEGSFDIIRSESIADQRLRHHFENAEVLLSLIRSILATGE